MRTMAKKSEQIEILLSKRKASREKMLKSMANLGFLQVWEGSVRSSKTVIALCSFCLYVTRSPETTFLLSGRTVKTIEQNAILEKYGILNLLPGSVYKKVGESRAILFSTKVDGKVLNKKIVVVGASDISAYMTIRGNTYAGWFADEINMHHPDFVAEAFNRTAMSTDRKHFWTLNPDNPKHWVYTEYLDRYDAMSKEERKRLGGYHWWHFTPIDNPAMTDEMLDSLKAQYEPGSFRYKRYVEGLRCLAEGLVFPEITEMYFRDFSKEEMDNIDIRYVSVDVGFNHPTVFHFAGMFGKGRSQNTQDWRIVDEIYDEKSGKTTYDYYVVFIKKCEELGVNPQNLTICIDPAALTLRTEFINRGLNVVRAKNDVLPGIEYMRRVVTTGHVLFSNKCKGLKMNLSSYSWDEKKTETSGVDSVIKTNDDACDSCRYMLYTFVRNFVR